MKAARRAAVLGAACGGLYAYDELIMCQVMQRGLRALYCGASIYINYKFIWTPENASEIHTRVARQIVDTCKTNEGLFVKFGQLLGSMQVALPPEYVGPLGELHDRAKTFDSATVRSILSAELPAGTLDQLTDLSVEPVASASVAQVHTAYWKGTKVAVKVQKPNIAVQNKYDLLVYRLVLSALEYSFEIPLVWSYDYVRRQLEQELDFTVEAQNARQCREDMLRHRSLSHVAYVPETFEASKRTIITEWIEDAVKITDTEMLKEMGIDSRAVITDATNMFAYQIFGSGHVHCDPHPGNLLVRLKPTASGVAPSAGATLSSVPGRLLGWVGSFWRRAPSEHQVVLIDHGLYVHLNDELRTDYIAFWMAMMLNDEEVLIDKCKKWGIHDSELFSSMTLMRRRDKKPKPVAAAGPLPIPPQFENEEMQDRALMTEEQKHNLEAKEKAARAVERSRQVKERVKNLLSDTSKFPHELGFVNRSVNYIRATNWAHGSPIDRVSIFASTAARASVGDRGRVGEWSLGSPCAVWGVHAHVLTRLWAPGFYYGMHFDRIKTCNKSTLWR